MTTLIHVQVVNLKGDNLYWDMYFKRFVISHDFSGSTQSCRYYFSIMLPNYNDILSRLYRQFTDFGTMLSRYFIDLFRRYSNTLKRKLGKNNHTSGYETLCEKKRNGLERRPKHKFINFIHFHHKKRNKKDETTLS